MYHRSFFVLLVRRILRRTKIVLLVLMIDLNCRRMLGCGLQLIRDLHKLWLHYWYHMVRILRNGTMCEEVELLGKVLPSLLYRYYWFEQEARRRNLHISIILYFFWTEWPDPHNNFDCFGAFLFISHDMIVLIMRWLGFALILFYFDWQMKVYQIFNFENDLTFKVLKNDCRESMKSK